MCVHSSNLSRGSHRRGIFRGVLRFICSAWVYSRAALRRLVRVRDRRGRWIEGKMGIIDIGDADFQLMEMKRRVYYRSDCFFMSVRCFFGYGIALRIWFELVFTYTYCDLSGELGYRARLAYWMPVFTLEREFSQDFGIYSCETYIMRNVHDEILLFCAFIFYVKRIAWSEQYLFRRKKKYEQDEST